MEEEGMMMTDNSSPGGSAGNGSKGEEERGTRSKEGRNNNGREIRSVTLSAPGKKALACSIDLRTWVTISTLVNDNGGGASQILVKLQGVKQGETFLSLNDNDNDDKVSSPSSSPSPLAQTLPFETSHLAIKTLALKVFSQRTKYPFCYQVKLIDTFVIIIRLQGVSIIVKSTIPIGAGLGSSAAFSVALAGALFVYEYGFLDKDKVNQLAMEAERFFHGKPSGIDNYTALNGGFIIKEDEDFKPFECQIPTTFKIIIINTGISRDTKRMIQDLQERISKKAKQANGCIASLKECAHEGIEAIKDGNWEQLSETIINAQDSLDSLGVSHPLIEEIRQWLKNTTGLSSKITGAGGGGCIIAFPFFGNSKESKMDQIRQQFLGLYPTCQFYISEPSSIGVRIEDLTE